MLHKEIKDSTIKADNKSDPVDGIYCDFGAQVILVYYSRPHYFLSQRLIQGKPLAEARGEIQYSASFLDWYSGEARRIYGQVVPATATNRTHLHTREPIGVVALITPVCFFSEVSFLWGSIYCGSSFWCCKLAVCLEKR